MLTRHKVFIDLSLILLCAMIAYVYVPAQPILHVGNIFIGCVAVMGLIGLIGKYFALSIACATVWLLKRIDRNHA